MKLTNKTVVITGGTSGIGYELVKNISKNNKVIVIGRDQSKLDLLQKEFNIISYRADLSKLNEVTIVCDLIVKKHDEIDVLINNAAIQYTPCLLDDDFQLETVTKEINTNLTSICYLIYNLLPSLSKETNSYILNINSGLALAPKTTSAIYCATKSALDSFSRSISYQLEETKISVYQSFLPLVDTKMTFGRGKGKLSAQEASNSIIKGLENQTERNYIGKTKILAFLLRICPNFARKVMKGW